MIFIRYPTVSGPNAASTMLYDGVIQSISRKGDCWDNSVAESFFHTLKTELTHHMNFKTKEEAKKAVFEYIEVFYNRKRMHSANDYFSPHDYEMNSKFN